MTTEFTQPAGHTIFDDPKVVGQSTPRIDGPLKVSGRAPYAYEYHGEAPDAAYGFLLGAGIAKGRIASIDTREAEAAPGVLLVMTHLNAPKQGEKGAGDARPEMASAQVRNHDDTVAFVVATSFEQARAAARLIRIDYAREPGKFDLAAERPAAVKPKGGQGGEADSAVGDFAGAFASAPVAIDVTYTTPDQSHAMLEPHATLAKWDGDRLTVYTANQMPNWAQKGLAQILLVKPDQVRVVSAYVGGGFGSKLFLYGDAICAAMAAKMLGRPVKVALTRPQIFNHTSHRPATIQRLRIGARRDGTITAIGHECWSGNQAGKTGENAAMQTRLLYGGANRMTAHRFATLDLPVGNAMRAPGEAAGLLALECAMDELAEKCGVDPVELRIRNDVQHDPEKGPGRPFSSRKLVECLRIGAERFGWARRNARPGQVRDGRWLVGMGVAGAIRDNVTMRSSARATLTPDGRILIESAMTDIGTGTYTVHAQIAAETLGVPLAQVDVRMGDTDMPQTCGSGGSWGANSSGTGVYYACEDLKAAIAQKAGFNATDALFAGGRVSSGNRSVPLAGLAGPEGITVEGGVKFGDLTERYAQASFGAHFCEVGVDMATAEVRVRRMLSVAACGRIINPLSARNQCLGGMTMGIGAALMEECVVDPRFGYFVNHDLAEYHVPVHADIPDMEVVFVDELDDKSSPLKAKGVGELGICGVGAAVANAIYNACGVRVRDYPITLDKILKGLPERV